MSGKVNIAKNNVTIDGGSGSVEIGTTSGVVIQGVSFATSGEMDIYVRALDGSDSNPGTISEPLESIIAAINMIPFIVKHPIRIHIGPHTGSGYSQPTIRDKILQANIYLIGDGGGGSTDGFTEIISSTAALAGSTNLLVKTSGLSTTEYGGFGELWGCTIEILTGAAAGDRRVIHHNTATDIIPNQHFSSSIAEGDTYRIVKPETIIYEPDSDGVPVLAENAGSQTMDDRREDLPESVHFINLRFSSPSRYKFIGCNARVNLYGIYCDKTIYMTGSNTYFSGKESVPTSTPPVVSKLVEDLGLPSNISWIGYGIVCDSTDPSDGLEISGVKMFDGGINVPTITTAGVGIFKLILIWGSLWGNSYGYVVKIYYNSEAEIGGYPFIPLYIGSPNESESGIAVEGNGSWARLICVTGTPVIKIQGSEDGLVAKRRGLIAAYIVNPNGMEIDVGNIGAKTKEQGMIIFTADVPTITSGVGDFSENDGAVARNISELAASGDFFSDLVCGTIYRE